MISSPDLRLGRLTGVGHLSGLNNFFKLFCPSGTVYRLPAKFGTPVRRAARRGRLWGCARQSVAKHRFAGLGRQRRQCRRAERHGYHSLTARQSRDLLMISGRVTTSPLRPPCIPPEAPQKKVFRFLRTARARGSSCGSFLPSLRSVRRSPSAPRKCHSPLSLWA